MNLMSLSPKSETNRKFSPISAKKWLIQHQKSIQFDDFKGKFKSDCLNLMKY